MIKNKHLRLDLSYSADSNSHFKSDIGKFAGTFLAKIEKENKEVKLCETHD